MAVIDRTYFLTGSQAGYFDGGIETLSAIPGGTTATVMLQFWNSKYLPRTPSPWQTIPPPYPWLWGSSPEFSAVIGDPLPQPPGSPGLLTGLGTQPIILASPTLVVHQTDTNTLAFSWHVAPDQYALVTQYVLQQTTDLNQPNWTTVTNFLSFATIPRPSTTTLYRLAAQ